MLTPIAIPPGVYRNGTELQSQGRWYDANLVRWFEGVMRPIGGWAVKSTSAIAAPARGCVSWLDNSEDAWLAVGTYEKLHIMRQDGAVKDITPVGFTSGRQNALVNTGYGGGYYGAGTYGTPRAEAAYILPATTWSLDTWGEYLVGCATTDGKIYQWTLDFTTPTKAAVITNAPIDCQSILVTAERILMALGADGDFRKVKWCDQENNTDWTPTTLNQAGDFDIQTQGRLMAGKRVRGTHLLFTDQDVHSATYIGQPFIYSFERLSNGCGLIGCHSVVVAGDSVAYWMSKSGFWAFDGAVRPLQSDVHDYVFSNINLSQSSKTYAIHIAAFSEVWWLYPSADSNEVDSYVIYNYRENHWSIGSMERSAGTGQSVMQRPLMVGIDGYVYEHEVGLAKDGASVYAESGPVQLGAGEQTMTVRQLVPDEKTQGDVNVSFSSRFYPNAAESTFGPYSTANPTSVRFSGRQVQMKIEQVNLSDWRVGTMRVDVTPAGRR